MNILLGVLALVGALVVIWVFCRAASGFMRGYRGEKPQRPQRVIQLSEDPPISMTVSTDRVVSAKVVGVTRMADNGRLRQNIIKKLKAGAVATLVREADNPYDEHAIRVLVGPDDIGYIGKAMAGQLSIEIDLGRRLSAIVSEITAGKRERHSLEVNLQITISDGWQPTESTYSPAR